jgi:hypothetical protein
VGTLVLVHHFTFWKFRACIPEVVKLADMVKTVVAQMFVHKVEIRFVNKMLCNF